MSVQKVAPFLIIILVVIIEALCGDVSYVRHVNPVNNNYTDSWPKLPSQQSAPLSGLYSDQKGTTPWPVLGQKQQYPNNNYSPSWGRSNQRTNTIMNSRRQYFSSSSIHGSPNFNSNSGSQYGGGRKGNVEQTVTPSEVTDNELREFSETILSEDVNNAAKYVTINTQGKTRSGSQKDEAPLPLLSIDKEAFKIPSIQKMIRLHDNYILKTNEDEDYTMQEQNEENALLDYIVGTSVMEHVRNFLIQKGRIGRDTKEFKETLREIWFNMYPRGGRKIGSSGFEHVFMAELKNNQVSGLHNWLYFNEEETNNRANYLGYMKKIDLGNKGAILKFHFTFHGSDKPVGSIFIGTSPELEMALYSTCFLLRADKICPLKLNGHRFIIRTFTYKYKGKNLIGSAFPDI